MLTLFNKYAVTGKGTPLEFGKDLFGIHNTENRAIMDASYYEWNENSVLSETEDDCTLNILWTCQMGIELRWPIIVLLEVVQIRVPLREEY